MLNKMIILLDEFSKIKAFAQKVVNYESDVMLIRNNQFYNAKSIMGIYAMDVGKPIEIQILSQDADEVRKFISDMSEFKA